MNVKSIASIILSSVMMIGGVGCITDNVYAASTDINLTIESNHANGGGSTGGGSTGGLENEHDNEKGEESGGVDGSGNKYHLRPGISVSDIYTDDGYIVGRSNSVYAEDEYLTRAEFAVIIDRVFEFDNEEIIKTFDDIQKHWGRESIERLASNGIIAGVSSKKFDPDGTLQRDHVLLMLARLLYTEEYKTETDKIDLNDHYSIKLLSQIINSGIYTYIPDNYNISANITRGEMVHIINNIIYARDNSKSEYIENFVIENNLFIDLQGDKSDVYYDDCLKSIDISYFK